MEWFIPETSLLSEHWHTILEYFCTNSLEVVTGIPQNLDHLCTSANPEGIVPLFYAEYVLWRVIVVKLADTKRCYILPSRLAQDSPRKQFEIVPEPLSKAIGVHFAGQEGWNFCNSLPMYLLEESKNK
ncbi:hypothetical protein Q1695_000213 [Nippostrongylus brasiliensis]|nr:hypothetical protein Q1695_000213 [Nippostrongylus brasiliensis]